MHSINGNYELIKRRREMNLFNDEDLSFTDDFEIEDAKTPVETKEDKDTEDKTDSKPTEEVEDGLIEVEDKRSSLNTEETEETIEDNLDGEDNNDIDDDEPLDKSDSSSSPFKPFAKALHEEGLISSFDDDEFDKLTEELGSPEEALMEVTRRSLLQEVEDYKKEQEEDYKKFIEAKEKGLDLNEWYKITENKKFYSSVSEEKLSEDENLQKQIVSKYLTEKGHSKEEVDELVEAYEDTAKLEITAKKHLSKLKELEDKKEKDLEVKKVEEEKIREQSRAKTIETLKTKIDEYKEIVPGLVINKQTKDKLFKNITQPVKEGPNGEPLTVAAAKRMEDPFKYAIIENYLIELGVFDGKFDKITAKQKSKAVSQLKNALSNSKNTSFKAGKDTIKENFDDFSLPDF